MRGYVLISVLAVMFFVGIAFGEEHGEGKEQQENIERQIHLRRMQMEMERQEMDLDFHRQIKDIELDERRFAIERGEQGREHHGRYKGCHEDGKGVFFLFCMIVNILLAVWVYGDIRKRGSGGGIWIVIVLLTGLFGMVPYAIVRLGDMRQAK